MEDANTPYLARIEWEPCSSPIEIAAPSLPSWLSPGCRKLTLRRNGDYRLVAELQGQVDQPASWGKYEDELVAEYPPGSIAMAGRTAHIVSEVQAAELSICPHGDSHITFGGDLNGSWNAFHKVYGYSSGELAGKSTGIDLKPCWMTEWYLNAPKDFVFPRTTRRSTTTTYGRERRAGLPTTFSGPTTEPLKHDYARVTIGNLDFIVHLVPSELCPSWSRGLGIEYAPGTPPPDTRRAIEEIVSFVLGRRLMRVGCTTFAADGFPVSTECVDPWAINIRAVCSSSDDSPFPIRMALSKRVSLEGLLRASRHDLWSSRAVA